MSVTSSQEASAGSVETEEGSRATVRAALAQRDATGSFHFAEALTLVMGDSRAVFSEPTIAATTA